MKYIGFKHQRENKQNSDKTYYCIMFDSLEICFVFPESNTFVCFLFGLAYFILFRMLTAVGILITKQISRGGESSCLLMTGLYYPQEHLADKTLMIIIFKYKGK
jgi:hypothetical protein